jgi:YegS/Rv2252/BmrU family lipid kinase
MSTEPVLLFANPVAGRGRAAKYFSPICNLLKERSVPVELILSAAPGDIEERIHDAALAGAQKVIVAGGDGSIHEAVNGIMRAKASTALGIIPVGTGNDFAKACNISLDWRLAASELASRITSGTPGRRIDVGKMNERYFGNGAGIGFDAKINRIARDIRWPIGDIVYLVAVFRGIRDGILTPSVVMQYADKNFSGSITLANISNGPWVGGMFHIAPMAPNNDGYLDLVVVAPVGTRRVLTLLPKLMNGKHISAPEVTCEKIRRFTLVSEAPVPCHLDGEAQALQTRFDIEICAAALQLL